MAAPTKATKTVAHGAVGLVGGMIANSLFGRTGGAAFLAGFLLLAFLHAELDAPLAKAMAGAGVQL